MRIRDAQVNEHGTIKNLRLAAYKEHEHKIPEEHWEILKEQIASDADLEQGVDRIVAELEGEIIGTVAVFPPKIDLYNGILESDSEYPEIRMLAVSSEMRGKGAATALLSECINRSRNRGHKKIGLHTSDFMEDAIQLYENLGFVRLPEFDFIPADDGIVVKAFQIHIESEVKERNPLN
ncbi:GNAT family N-acetyltransferase [Oceanobacillus piezotolerans]|uniref:GNAT family N-acetyltransferase n=1 Tax=Oceanobacillus piezotolerans TaxID=2448030 RepID=A0A498DC70_9BACI|nr:GNAT family N-acetyltransferase [Oceanobacillus piezotolerans]RLL43721.1 GNAT family N-acetyltransferase [Oceanobacillus piezotolerans]